MVSSSSTASAAGQAVPASRAGNPVRRAWDRLKSWFSRPRARAKGAVDEMFTPIDVDEVWAELELGAKATRFGEAELPDRDDVELDGPQKQLQQRVNEAINDAFRRANVELERLSAAFRDRDIERPVEALRDAPAKAAERIHRRTEAVDAEIGKFEAEAASERAKIDEYRARYGIERRPELKERSEIRMLVVWTILLAFGQAIVNTTFFAQGIRWGLAAGLGLAFVLGVSDVVMHYAIGRLGSRLHAPSWVDRLVGGTMTLLAVLSIPVWNLGIVHLRNGVRLNGFEQGVEQWLPSLLGEPFGFTDFTSWALLVIGAACSLSALVTGWKWDEPIPLFRRAGRRLRDAEADIEEYRDHRAGIEREERDALEEEMATLRERIEFNLQASESIVGRMTRLRENLSVFVDDAARAFHALIQRYRDENRVARSTEPPGYFHRPAEIDTTHPLELDLSAMNRRLDAQRRLWQAAQRELAPAGGSAPASRD